MWSGNFDEDDVSLTPEVNECGCYFVDTVMDKVNSCPSVNLGDFFVPPLLPPA